MRERARTRTRGEDREHARERERESARACMPIEGETGNICETGLLQGE